MGKRAVATAEGAKASPSKKSRSVQEIENEAMEDAAERAEEHIASKGLGGNGASSVGPAGPATGPHAQKS